MIQRWTKFCLKLGISYEYQGKHKESSEKDIQDVRYQLILIISDGTSLNLLIVKVGFSLSVNGSC